MQLRKTESNLLLYFVIISFLSQQTQIVPVHVQYVTFFFIITSVLFANKVFKMNHNIYVLLFVVITSLSIFVSFDKQLSLVRFVTLTAMISFLFYVVDFERNNLEKLLKFLFFASSIYIVVSFLNMEYLKDYKGEFEGYIRNRYNISALFGVYFILGLAMVVQVKRIWLTFCFLIVSTISIYLIFISYSRVGFFYIGLYVLSLIGIYILRSSNFKRFFALVVFFTLLVVAFFELKSIGYIEYAIERGVTGRDVIADILLNHMYNNTYSLVLGFGPGSLESIAPNILHRVSPRDVNNIVGVLFEYGLLGLLAFFTLFLRYFYQLYKLCRLEGVSYSYLCIPIPIIFSVSEVSWLNFNTFPTLVMFLFMSYTYYVYSLYKLDISSRRVESKSF